MKRRFQLALAHLDSTSPGSLLHCRMLLFDEPGVRLDRYDELAWPVDVLRLPVDQRTAAEP